MSTFCDTFHRLRQELDQARQDRLQIIHRLQSEVQRQAEQTISAVAAQDRGRRAEFQGWMRGLREGLHAQAQLTRTRLAELSDDLRGAAALFHRTGSTN